MQQRPRLRTGRCPTRSRTTISPRHQGPAITATDFGPKKGRPLPGAELSLRPQAPGETDDRGDEQCADDLNGYLDENVAHVVLQCASKGFGRTVGGRGEPCLDGGC